VIEGLKIELPSNEIRVHLEVKARAHREKQATYEKQVEELKAIGVGKQAQTMDPLSTLQNSAASHAKRAEFFEFMAKRIIPNETYRLQEHDLERLEWFSRYG